MQFNPVEVANNLKRTAGSSPASAPASPPPTLSTRCSIRSPCSVRSTWRLSRHRHCRRGRRRSHRRHVHHHRGRRRAGSHQGPGGPNADAPLPRASWSKGIRMKIYSFRRTWRRQGAPVGDYRPQAGHPTISTGNILRAAVKEGTPSACRPRAIWTRASWFRMRSSSVSSRSGEPDCAGGFILDGGRPVPSLRPKPWSATASADAVLPGGGRQRHRGRMTGRRTCHACGATYHVMAPQARRGSATSAAVCWSSARTTSPKPSSTGWKSTTVKPSR